MSALPLTPQSNTNNRNELHPVSDQRELIVFDFVALTAAEVEIRGYIDALDEESACQTLAASGLRLTRIKRSKGTRKKKRRGFGPADISRLAAALGAHRKSGRNWDQSLLEIARTSAHPKLKLAAARAADEIIFNGKEPHDALNLQKLLPESFINAIRIGLKSGKDVEMLEKMRKDYMRIANMLKQIRKASTYPAIVAAAAVIAFTLMMIFFVPAMKQIFEGMLAGGDTSLPWPTQLVVNISDIIASAYGVAIFAAIFTAIWGFFRWKKTEAGKLKWQRIQLEIPKIGPILRKYHAANAARSISTLYGAVSLTENIKETGNAMSNVVYKEIFDHIHSMLVGERSTVPPIDRAMAPFAYHLGYNITTVCSNARADGNIDFHFGNHADELDAHVTEQIDNLVEFIQPAFIVIICSVVGSILIALYLPLFELIGRMANASTGMGH